MKVGLVIVAIVVVLVIAVIASYNRFVRQRNLVQESWRQVDVELKRRYDLIPNLIETVKGYAAHESGVLQAVTAARTAAEQAGTVAQQATAETTLGRSLGGLFAVAENYPTLKADSSFLALQSQLGETEDRIAAARRFYNANVRDYNIARSSFPTMLVAGFGDFPPQDFFEVEDSSIRNAPQVSFSPGQT